jgi:PTH1 family peptidyl-tRNA hydrolase
MKLIVGLGNPGSQYARTRHNVGFRIIDRLAAKLGTVADRSKFKGEYATADAPVKGGDENDDGKLLLVKPQTFMNLSGETVVSFSGYFKIELKDILVAVDDVALPLGVLRMRRGGTDGGHNGLRDITRALGSQDYARLRLGVGGREQDAQRPAEDLASHVLSRFSKEEEAVLEPAIDKAVEACSCWAAKGIEAAMNSFNAKEKKDAKGK